MTDDLDPVNRLLKGEEPEEWLQYNSRDKLDCIDEHEDAVEAVQYFFEEYMLAYGLESENLINPDIKYNDNRDFDL